MKLAEIEYAIAMLRHKYGVDEFNKVAKEVYFNLNQMKLNSHFDYQKYFVGDRLGIFLVVAHRFIVDHPEYEFSDDYSVIRRTDNSLILAHQAKQRARLEAAMIEE